jgi:two-component system, OmpR family, manganese sensing sensor histidine kinase
LFKRSGQVHTVTIAVYTNNLESKNISLEGYIRASESTEQMDTIRNKLQLGLAIGGTLALLLISISSIYLTQQTIIPVKHGLKKLKKITTDVSHQLRTPLTRISMATEILLTHTDKIQPSDTRKLKIINDAVEQLKHLIEDLLSLIRIDLTGNVEELQITDVSLNLLLQTLKVQFVPLAHTNNIDLQIQIQNNISIRGNTAELKLLLTNLLENALNYTECGGKVHLSANLSEETVVVSVQDTGIGITEQDLPFIFQHFWRGESAKSRRPEGSGLGLTIARAIVQRQGGIIKVNSQPGQGSCFEVNFT